MLEVGALMGGLSMAQSLMQGFGASSQAQAQQKQAQMQAENANFQRRWQIDASNRNITKANLAKAIQNKQIERTSLSERAIQEVYQKFGFDFLFKYRGFSVLGEFIKTSATVPKTISQRVRADGTAASTFLVNGVQDVPNYVKGRMMLGTGFNIQAGYLFTNGFSIDARYTKLQADANSFLNNATFYNRPEFYSLCASRYLNRNYGAKIQASVTWNKANAGSVTITGKPLTGNELSAALMFTFSL
jgi:hypothetical protein